MGEREYQALPDPLVVFADVERFVDPIVVCRDFDTVAVGAQMEELRTRVNGVQTHRCPQAEPGKLYVVDRKDVVDQMGLCLVCGGETT